MNSVMKGKYIGMKVLKGKYKGMKLLKGKYEELWGKLFLKRTESYLYFIRCLYIGSQWN